MKKTLLSILAVTLLLTTAATSLSAKQAKQQQKPFLIQGKLPHLTMMLKILWDDEDLALTQRQKEVLLVIRQQTMSSAKSLGKEIFKLENKVVNLSKSGKKPEEIKPLVEKIADLRVNATLIHLDCIYKTRAILSKEQLYILE
ncbi:MAG: hypothetical protein Q9M34_08530 [Sulfurimonas sp.]|nr:hypothetical protein [Sulfurimonas sp.]